MPRLADPRFAPDVAIELDGRRVFARAGEPVAVALLSAGERVVARSLKYHRPRGAFCLEGSCHACTARVDGVPSERTCLVPCRDGLRVESQNAAPTARRDLLAVVDAVYRRGLDHHHLMTWNALANRAAVAVSRRLAGLGTLPHRPAATAPAREERREAVVVGAGPAGLAAAVALARRGARPLLAEAAPAVGGRLRARLGLPGDPPGGWAAEAARQVAADGGELATGVAAVGVWWDGDSPAVLLRDARAPGLRLVRTARLVLATGTQALPPVFPRNDLPGVLAARGALVALAEHGFVPGGRAVVLGEGEEAHAVAARLAAAGVAVRAAPSALVAHGRSGVAAVTLAGGERVRCDWVVYAGPRAPAADLARAAGAAAEPDPASGGFRVRAGPDGAAGLPGLLAAGEVGGATSAAQALEAGRRAGERA